MTWILPYIASLLFALVLSPIVIWIYTRFGWMDDPSKSNHPKIVHTKPLPRGGGLVVGLSILASIALFVPLSIKIGCICLCVLILIVLGFLDDIASPHPIIRLAIMFGVALLTQYAGITISFVTNPLGGIIDFSQLPLLTLGIGVIWIVWCMNIVNFSTGLDGQMPGFVAIAAGTIAILSLRFFPDPAQLVVFRLAVITAGSFLGFLYWNSYPQKIMSGFGASTIGGFLLAILSIYSQSKLATAILVLAIPMSDAVYVIVRRLIKKRSPLWGDRSHLHHALLDAGFSKSAVARMYWISALLLGLCALTLSSGQKIFAILLIVAIVCIIGTWLRIYLPSFGKSDHDNG